MKRFDINADYPLSKAKILTKEQFKIYNSEELKNKTPSEKMQCCTWMLWTGETLTFWTYNSRYCWLRVYDKLVQVKKDWIQNLYKWITQFKDLQRFEIEYNDKRANSYLWDHILWNKNNILENIYFEDIKRFIPQFKDLRSEVITPESFNLDDKLSDSIEYEYFELWGINEKYRRVFSWWCKNLFKKVWWRWLATCLFEWLKQKQKDQYINDFIKYTYNDSEKIQKLFESIKEEQRLYMKRIESKKYKHIIKVKNSINDIELMHHIEESIQNPETSRFAKNIFKVCLRRIEEFEKKL